MDLSTVVKQYPSLFSAGYDIYFSPGRINLIGEHIDYLGGRVFPTAISLGIYAIVSKRDDRMFHFRSHNFPHAPAIVVSPDELEYQKTRGWANYAVGMMDALTKRGMTIQHGLNIVVYGTLPNGAGLSSSASLEILMGIVLEDQFDEPTARVDLVQIAKRVENEYVGVNCGIMDQFAVGMSQKDHAIYLDTETLEYAMVPLQLGDHSILIANSNVKRGLVDSKYNERREECEQGLAVVQSHFEGIQNLCDLTIEEFESIQDMFPSPTIMKRVRHAVTEHKRTQQAVTALRQNDIYVFGKILNDGHESIRDDFEVSSHELDVLQESFLKHGAIGARMTGAGFGGCVIAIVPNDLVKDVQDRVQSDYTSNTEYQAEFYRCETSDGATKLDEEEWQ